MKSRKIAVGGEVYLVTEKNQRSGLYQLYCFDDDSIHIVGRSYKTDDWLYIQKSPFSNLLCPQKIAHLIEEFISCQQTSRAQVN